MRKTATITVNGKEFSITYEYMILNDGGDYKLIIWEPLPPGAPSDEFGPDLIHECNVDNEVQVEVQVEHCLKAAIKQLIHSQIEIRSF